MAAKRFVWVTVYSLTLGGEEIELAATAMRRRLPLSAFAA